jgi:hypothetical protein
MSKANEKKSLKSRGSEPAGSEAAPVKRLTLDIPAELHRAIKINAVEEGVTMVEKLRTLLMEHYGLAGSRRRGAREK